jgi:hypothetical protein
MAQYDSTKETARFKKNHHLDTNETVYILLNIYGLITLNQVACGSSNFDSH